jgi:hypothetical protein
MENDVKNTTNTTCRNPLNIISGRLCALRDEAAETAGQLAFLIAELEAMADRLARMTSTAEDLHGSNQVPQAQVHRRRLPGNQSSVGR